MSEGISFNKLMNEIKKIKSDGYFITEFPDHYCGNVSRNKKGTFKVGLGFNAKEILRDDVEGIPMRRSDFKLMPIIIWIKPSEEQYKIWDKFIKEKKGEVKKE